MSLNDLLKWLEVNSIKLHRHRDLGSKIHQQAFMDMRIFRDKISPYIFLAGFYISLNSHTAGSMFYSMRIKQTRTQELVIVFASNCWNIDYK